MAKLDPKAKYNEFSKVGDKFCIGGNEILHIWHSPINGWTWFATKVITKDKIPNIYEGYVEGDFPEWGSWYASDMNSSFIEEVPKSNWGMIEQHHISQ